MGTKTIGLRDDVYERLKARKRDEESFTELVDRLLEDSDPDWREGFGTLPEAEGAELDAIVSDSRTRLSDGLSERQNEALELLSDEDHEDDDPKTA
ncbi:antitoxin VapB family protein [Natronorubrum texcoconense]|uniref:Predicted antitoxin, CopG family n=1 Tax=Natronorubrum texcoconense TaxID=1095776 RepID=A0A1G8Y871_9EURY|nr:antitoxin VapB family protein [Natronorubrum texcoconense]SDJ99002.1 Predicted antitoxin, CopG family [Natronorubrum texcoconense]